MTIKKLKTVKAAPQTRPPEAAPAEGEVADLPADAAAPKAATIADRFKLDAPDPAAKAATESKKGAQLALTAALVALAVMGVLTFVLYQHWEFLMST